VAGCIVFSLLGLWTAIPRADVAQGRPATVVSARAGTPDRRIDAAIVSLAQLVEQHPYNTDWKYELGRLHAMKQNWSQAERWYRAVLQDNPNESRALNSLAEVLGREQQRP
jgi:Flp pilus assembly protein TadD